MSKRHKKIEKIPGLKGELSEAEIAELQGSSAEQHSKSQTVDNTPRLFILVTPFSFKSIYNLIKSSNIHSNET